MGRAPGGTVSTTVTITPSAARGAAVSRHLNLVTVPGLGTTTRGANPSAATGEVPARLPYSYTAS